jgi:AraC family transcriptional regulator
MMERSGHQTQPLTFGHCLRRSETGGFVYSEKVYSSHLVIPRHIHNEEAVLMVVLAGYMLEVRDTGRDECRPRSLALNPAGEAHGSLFGTEGARCLVIEVGAPRLKAARECSAAFAEPLCTSDERLVGLAWGIHGELRSGDEAARLAVEGLTLELLAEIARRPTTARQRPSPDWLQEARDYLHASFSERFDLTELARAVGVHPAHLAREFRRHFHCTAGEYVRRLRLDRALEQLLRSEESIAEIATSSGFYDQSHFSRAIKARTGLSPAAYRAARRDRKSRTQ